MRKKTQKNFKLPEKLLTEFDSKLGALMGRIDGMCAEGDAAAAGLLLLFEADVRIQKAAVAAAKIYQFMPNEALQGIRNSLAGKSVDAERYSQGLEVARSAHPPTPQGKKRRAGGGG